MATLTEVYSVMDRRIEDMEKQAARPCIEALMDGLDRDGYREAIRLASGLRAVRALRKHLVDCLGTGEERATSTKARASRAAKA